MVYIDHHMKVIFFFAKNLRTAKYKVKVSALFPNVFPLSDNLMPTPSPYREPPMSMLIGHKEVFSLVGYMYCTVLGCGAVLVSEPVQYSRAKCSLTQPLQYIFIYILCSARSICHAKYQFSAMFLCLGRYLVYTLTISQKLRPLRNFCRCVHPRMYYIYIYSLRTIYF